MNTTFFDNDITDFNFDQSKMIETKFSGVVMSYSQFMTFIQYDSLFQDVTLVPGNEKSEIVSLMANTGAVNKKDFLKNYICNHMDVRLIDDLEEIFQQVSILDDSSSDNAT